MDKDSPKEFCDLCLIEGRRVVNIKNTYLHPLYEKLSNMKIESEMCCMCYICHTRLRQCHQLSLLAERSTRRLHMAFIDPLEVVSKSKVKSLLDLSQSETVTTFIHGDEVQNKSDVKQEARFFFYDREVQKKNEQIRDKCSEDAEELSESSLESELDSDNDEQPIKREVLEKRDEQLVAEPPNIPMDIQREDLQKADKNFFAMPIENPDAQIKMESTHGVDICHIISVQKKNEQIRDKCSEDAEELSESSLESELDSDNDEQPIKREVLEKRDEQLVAEPPDIPMDIQREDLQKADRKFFAMPIENPDAQIKMESTHGVDICHIISVQKKNEQIRDKCSEDAEELSESSLESELDSDNDEQPIKREVLEKRDEQLVAEPPDIPMDIQREDLQKTDENFFAIPIENPDAQIKMESMDAKNSLSDSHIKVEMERQTEFPSYLIEYEGNPSSESDSSEDLSSLDLPPPMSTARQRPRHVLNPRPTIESMANRPHACDLCPRRFKLKTGLTQHRKTHTGEKPYSCEHCNRKFRCRTNLKTHRYTHTGEKPYSCDICQRKFTNSSQLRRHIPRHVDFRPFQCQFCDKLFLLKDVYQKHVARHTAVDEFRCDICQTKYKTQQSLRIHYRSHTGEKPYCCDVCGLRFVVNKQLERHATVHTNLKPFACQICPATFKTKHCLRAHEKRHTGDDRFTCNVCQRRFSHNCDLRNHMRTHVGDRPFACDYCPSKFYQRSTLNTHIRTHTGEKPYTCDVCQRKFTQKSSLTRHRRTHNSKEYGRSEARAEGCPPLEERSVVNAHEFHT